MDGAAYEYLTLTEAAKLCPGRRPEHRTLIRWIRKGCRGVRLRAIYNDKWYTTARWLIQFFVARTDARISAGTHPDAADEAADAAMHRVAEKWGING